MISLDGTLRVAPRGFFLADRFYSNLDDFDRRFKDGILDLLANITPSNESAAYNAFLLRLQEDFGLGKLEDAQNMKGKRNQKMRSMSSSSINSGNHPNNDATEILQQVIAWIKEDANIKQAASMTNISRNFDRLKKFLDRFDILARLRPKYGDPQMEMEIIVPYAHRNVRKEFWRLFDEIPSHVVVCNSSVCNLACDAFLCPVASDAGKKFSGTIWEQWQSQTEARNPQLRDELTGRHDHVDFHRAGNNQRVAVLRRWKQNQPVIFPLKHSILMQIGLWNQLGISYTSLTIMLKRGKPKNRRERHFLALPVIGTGGGGAKGMTGEVVEKLFDVLNESTRKVDCVLVAADEATYAHAQTVRTFINSQIKRSSTQPKDLAELGASGQLSLFFGAGTSIPSGLPDWEGLLNAMRLQLASSGTTGLHKIKGRVQWTSPQDG